MNKEMDNLTAGRAAVIYQSQERSIT